MQDTVAVVNGLCLVGNEFVKANVLLENGVIKEVTKRELKADEVLDARKCLVLPGFFNSHTHVAMTLLRCAVEDVPLMEWLKTVWSIESKMKEKDVYVGAKLGIAEMIKSGVTCFSDQYFHMDGVARAVEESGIRAVLGYGMIDMESEEKREKELREAESFINEWNGRCNRITLSVDPHSPYTCSKDLLLISARMAEEYGLPVHIHVAETEDEVRIVREKTGKTPVEYLDELGIFNYRTVAAHCVWLSDDEIKLLARRGVSVAHCPVSNLKLGSGIARVAEMVREGVNVCLGTDGAASNNSLSVLGEMKFAALLQKFRLSPAAIKALDVLKMATENGYSAYGLRGGKIEVGYLADLVVLKKSLSYTPLYNPVYSVVYSSYGFEVRDLIVDGKILMNDGKLRTMDEESLLDEAESASLRLQEGFSRPKV